MALEFNNETPGTDALSALDNLYTDFTGITAEEIAKIIASDAELSYSDYEFLAPYISTEKQLSEVRAKIKPDHSRLKGVFLRQLNSTKNKYAAPASETRLQLGPLTYGAEVQSIKIIENKALGISSGVRTAGDFIVDGGAGDADVQVTLLFSGEEHISKALRPLVALFRLSPITSVKNDTIKGALYNRFTENKGENVNKGLIEEEIKKITKSEVDARTKELLVKIYGESTGHSMNELTFTIARNRRLIPIDKTYESFANDYSYEYQLKTILSNLDRQSNTQPIKESPASSGNIDNTGFVPMAMIGLEFSTHPELPEAIICNLMLKRVNVGNFLSDFLRYRDANGNPVNDPKDAFWLNRAIDKYIDRFIRDDFLSWDNFGTVELQYKGSDAQLDRFKEKEKLNILYLNNGKDTFVSQVTYGIYHKFHFCRLIGQSYPTVQHMGTSSGDLRLSIVTPQLEQFSNIHSYKSAADFFVRHVESITRFNGWEIDTFLVRLLNFTPNKMKQGQLHDDIDAAFYPSQVISTTNDELPGLHDIAISFKASNPKFFEDFGFTISKGDHNVQSLWKFYSDAYDQAVAARAIIANSNTGITDLLENDDELDLYSFNLLFGDGDERQRMMILNPDTLVAMMLQPDSYNFEKKTFNYPEKGNSDEIYTDQLREDLSKNSKINSELYVEGGAGDSTYQQLGSLDPFYVFGDIKLTSRELAKNLTDLYFDISDAELKEKVISLVVRIAEPGAREDLYYLIFSKGKIGFTDTFKTKLFSAVVLRRNDQKFKRVFDRSGVIKAFHALVIAYDAKGQDFFPEENAGLYVKGKTNETKLKIDNNGKLSLTDTVNTSYNDYMYITYDELFTLEDIPGARDDARWTKYGLRYKDVGAINADLSFFGDQGTWTSDAIITAQDQLISTKNSPVSPDVFFYKEYELDSFHKDIDSSYSNWFNKLDTLMVDIPFDIEDIDRDSTGLSTGTTSVNTPGSSSDQLSTRIEKNAEYHRRKSGSTDKWRDMAIDVLSLEMRYLMDTKGWTISELKAAARNKGPNYDKLKEELAQFSASTTDGLLVPFLQGRGINSQLARYEKITGIAGAGIARVITEPKNNEVFDTYIAETITRAADGRLTDVSITNANLEETKAAMMKVIQATPDNGNSMAKAFPVMRLYLIEERGPNFIIQDNFYGYHAIDSIDITLDKHDAGLAVIRVADPFRILQGSSVDIKSTDGDLKDTITLPTDGELDENFQSRVKLRQGRHIQIRGGYSASSEHLDIIFTGRIAEVQFGDMVTIVAQGWKAEIAGKQVSFGIHSTSDNSVKDLVTRTILEANPKGIGTYFSGREFVKISQVLGDMSGGEQAMQARLQSLGTSSNSPGGGADIDIFGFSVVKNVGTGVDMKLKNIWVPDRDPMRWNPFKNAILNGWQGTRWTVPVSSAWDVLQSATNYVFGYICQVVPFDSEATLFFGKPESMYYYTTGDKRIGRLARQQRTKQIKEVKDSILPVINIFNNGAWKLDREKLISNPGTVVFATSGPYAQLIEDNTRLNKKDKLLKSDHTEHFNILRDELSNEVVVAIVLIASFTGLSLKYIQKNVEDPVSLVKNLLKRKGVNEEAYIREAFNSGASKDAIDQLNKDLSSDLEKKGKGKYTIDDINNFLKVLKSDEVNSFTENYNSSDNYNPDLYDEFPDALVKVFKSLPYFNEKYNDFRLVAIRELFTHKKVTTYIFSDQSPDGTPEAFRWDLNEVINDATAILSLVATDYIAKSQDSSILTNFYDPDFIAIANAIHPRLYSNEEDLSEIGNTIVENRWLFKKYVESLSGFVTRSSTSTTIQEAREKTKEMFTMDPRLLHNMKVFRDYHYIRNDRDIISNDLAATTREMFNTVVVKFPEELNTSNDSVWKIEGLRGNYDDVQIESSTTWTTWPRTVDGHIGMQFDDSVTLEDKKMGVYTDLNITRKEQAAIAATNVLAKMMRPMYRNSITIMGRVIKPWDHVYLDDKYTDMRGMVDVERVVHHYSASTGWTTKIVPHAICEANPGNRQIQSAVFESKMDTIYNASEIALDTIVLISLIPTLGASLEAGVALKAAGKIGQKGILAGIKGVATDVGVRNASKQLASNAMSNIPTALRRYIITQGELYVGDFCINSISTNMRAGASSLPVVMSPVNYKGVPLQAGLHGTDETYWSLGSRLHWSQKSIREAYAGFFDALTAIGQDGIQSENSKTLDLVGTNNLNK